MTIEPWEVKAQKGKDILTKSIPKQWLCPDEKLPPVEQKSVLEFPRQSGLLSERELGITDMSATALVAAMGKGELSAEETVVAFLKRAVLGHQLVRLVDSALFD
jgi:amidase